MKDYKCSTAVMENLNMVKLPTGELKLIYSEIDELISSVILCLCIPPCDRIMHSREGKSYNFTVLTSVPHSALIMEKCCAVNLTCKSRKTVITFHNIMAARLADA